METEDELYRIRVALERMVLLFETVLIKLDRKEEAIKPEETRPIRTGEEFNPFV